MDAGADRSGVCGRFVQQRGSRQLRVSLPTVGKWRRRFVKYRLDGLSDEPRPGAPRKLSDAQVARVVTTTPEELPGVSLWFRQAAAAAGVR